MNDVNAHIRDHGSEKKLSQPREISRRKNSFPENSRNLPDLHFININRSRETFSHYTRKNIYDRETRMITFARLRFVVRQICDGFVPTVWPNLLSRNSTLTSNSLFISYSIPFSLEKLLKMTGRLLYSFP